MFTITLYQGEKAIATREESTMKSVFHAIREIRSEFRGGYRVVVTRNS
jgi:hypothetical protein